MIELTGYRDKHEYTNKHGVKSVVYLMDCMTAMEQMGDKEFGLLCSDPPYGINVNHNMGRRKGQKASQHKKAYWDNESPSTEVFGEMFRVSVNQAVWGANHFISKMPYDSACWLMWDKGFSPDVSFAQFELCWTSFEGVCKKFDASPNQPDRIHSTQKPVALYDWIFHNYAKPNDTIFDSHLGSGSSRIAADKHNLPFLGVELDPDYFRDHCKRFDRYTAQLTLF